MNEKIQDVVSKLSIADFEKMSFEQLLKLSNTLIEFLLEVRDQAVLCAPKRNLNVADRDIFASFNVNIKKIYVNEVDYYYDLTLPLLLSKSKSRLNPLLVKLCVQTAVSQYQETEGTLFPVSSPVLFFENCYANSIYDISDIKDADNYEVGSIVNALQGIFYGDDRDTTLIIRNKGFCPKNETILHIFPFSLTAAVLSQIER